MWEMVAGLCYITYVWADFGFAGGGIAVGRDDVRAVAHGKSVF